MEKKYNITTPENVAPEILARLKDVISSFYPHERYVALAFDHLPLISVAPHLFSSKNAANRPKHKYILILTIRFLTTLMYQPIACLFWNGSEEKCLADLLHVYINALIDTRSHVVATVCPAEQCFINAVQHMTQIKDMLIHNGPIIFSTQRVKDIVHIFDPPKLLKNTRNLYMQYPIMFKYMEHKLLTSWADIELFYDLTDDLDSLDLYAKYFFPASKQLHCTAYAAKVFSKSLSLNLFEMIQHYGQNSDGFSAASHLCAFFNNVFDSFNAHVYPKYAPSLRKPVSKNSIHMATWNAALDMLDSMYIIIPQNEVNTINGNLNGNLADNFVHINTPASTQSNMSDKSRRKKMPKKDKDDKKVKRKNVKKISKTEKNVEVILDNFYNLSVQEELALKVTKEMENNNDVIDYCVDALTPQKTKLPPVHYWKLNVMGIKVLVEKLFQLHFKTVNTKVFNVDNVLSFFNLIRTLNEQKMLKYLHEDINFGIIDETIALMCLKPSATYILVPNPKI